MVRIGADLLVHEAAIVQDLLGSHVQVDIEVQRVGIMVVHGAVADVHEGCHDAASCFLLLLIPGAIVPGVGHQLGLDIGDAIPLLDQLGNDGVVQDDGLCLKRIIDCAHGLHPWDL